MLLTNGCTHRMTTSKLYVDPAHVAEAEENDFAKFVFLSYSPPTAIY